MLGVNVIAAETDEKAQWLATSQQLQFLGITTGMPSQLKPPVDNIEDFWSPQQKASIAQTLDSRTTIVGSPETVKQKLESFIQETRADELIINTQIFNHEDRLRSYEIVADMMN